MILEFPSEFLFPEIILDEFAKYYTYLLRKSRMRKNEFELLFSFLLRKMKIVKNADLVNVKSDALRIIQHIDVNDVLFIACALAFPNSILWSNDRKLKQQTDVVVMSTSEILKLFQNIDGKF